MDTHGGCSHNDFGERKLVKDKHIEFICNGFDYESMFTEFERVCKIVNCLIFCSNKQISKTMAWWENKGYSTTLLIWDKPNPIPLSNLKHISNLEFIVFVRGKGATFNCFDYHKMLKTYKYPAPVSRIHPTEKPIALLRHLLQIHSNENQLVLDCFSGSGSTGIACHLEKRNFILSEIDVNYYNTSNKALEVYTNQLTLF
jgi:DNA modification methylase